MSNCFCIFCIHYYIYDDSVTSGACFTSAGILRASGRVAADRRRDGDNAVQRDHRQLDLLRPGPVPGPTAPAGHEEGGPESDHRSRAGG